jgi:hypothetical protein
VSKLAVEYTFFIFVASCGVLQLAAVHSGLRGLSFLKRPLAANLLGALAVIGAYIWFFASENRNVPGLEGSQQLGYFTLGASIAIVFTLVVSSLLRAGINPSQTEGGQEQGLNALRGMTYFQAIRRAIIRLLKSR